MKGLLTLSWRNFSRNVTRYRVLLLALTLVIMVFTLVLGLVGGMTNSLRSKAARYFAGDIAVQEFVKGQRSVIQNPQDVLDVFTSLPLGVITTSLRSVYYTGGARLFFAGNYLGQRRLVGVEWDREAEILEGFDFFAGSVPQADDTQAILISTAAADHLGVGVGDELLVSLRTLRGQSNTGYLIVRGIFDEASFFGYTSYLHRQTLNNLQAAPADQVNEMGIYLQNRSRQTRFAPLVWSGLDQIGQTFPLLETKDQRDKELNGSWEGSKFAVLSLDAQLAEIKDLLDALTLAALAIIVLFAALVVIGVSNTYSMVVFERTGEIGTIRALGMTRARVITLFLWESLWLGAFGIIAGLGLGLGVLELIHQTLDLSGSGWAALFLVQGRLVYSLNWLSLGGVAFLSLGASLGGAAKSAIRASKMSPVDALRQG